MILHLNTTKDFKSTNALDNASLKATIIPVKKKKTWLQVTYIKVKIFFWNLSPFHWYDGFSDIKIDMNEFVKPTKKQI